ncbi:MAG: SDR family oxidoreductase [Zunongwangia sp.]
MKKTILITGTSSGIGYSIAKEFSEANYKVIATIRKVKDAERLKKELNENVYPIICDVTNPEQVNDLARYVKEISLNGLLDGLINNAAIEIVSPIEFQDLEDTRTLFETNLFGLMHVTQTLLPLLGTSSKANKHTGRIINVSSVGGVLSLPFLSAYATTKHALEGYSHSLRRELSLFGIKVIILAPGAIKSKIWEKDQLDKKSYNGSRYE